ncbi:MAG: hypothetical protein RLN81_00035 [Balneolaceae bacterium]
MKNILQILLVLCLLVVITLLVQSQFTAPVDPSSLVKDIILGLLILGSSFYALKELRSLKPNDPFRK